MGESILTRKGGSDGGVDIDIYAKSSTNKVYRLTRTYNITGIVPVGYLPLLNTSNNGFLFDYVNGVNVNAIKNYTWANIVEPTSQTISNHSIFRVTSSNSSQPNIYVTDANGIKHREYKVNNVNGVYDTNYWIEDNNASNAVSINNVYFGWSAPIDGPVSVSTVTNNTGVTSGVMSSNNTSLFFTTQESVATNTFNLRTFNYALNLTLNTNNIPFLADSLINSAAAMSISVYTEINATSNFIHILCNGWSSTTRNAVWVVGKNIQTTASTSVITNVQVLATNGSFQHVGYGLASSPNYVYATATWDNATHSYTTLRRFFPANLVTDTTNGMISATTAETRRMYGNLYLDKTNQHLYMLVQANVANNQGIWKINAINSTFTSLIGARLGYINIPINVTRDKIVGDGANIYFLSNSSQTISIYNASDLTITSETTLPSTTLSVPGSPSPPMGLVGNYIILGNHAFYKNNIQFSHFLNDGGYAKNLGTLKVQFSVSPNGNLFYYNNTSNLTHLWDGNNIAGNNAVVVKQIYGWTGVK